MPDRTDSIAPIEPTLCPSWCTLPAGHTYDPDPVSGYHRFHRLRISPSVTVDALEQRSEDGAHVELADPFVAVRGDVDGLDPATAYDLGDDLNVAARRCEQIRAGVTS